ncbi:MAG: hypothetical protein LBV29_03405 [Azoarcus sp.]|jgi:flagellar biosynthesis/type III secretory pathway protein FliH|nr:hypothetical protein [Azoarcus sp.]
MWDNSSFSDTRAGALNNARDEGYTGGHLDGFGKGLGEGQKIGYDQGFADGRNQGYREGYDNGWNACVAQAAPQINVGNECIAFLEGKLSVVVPALAMAVQLIPAEMQRQLPPDVRELLRQALQIKVYEVEPSQQKAA